MKVDDELETWRRQWHSQPAVPIDLIRKVERDTIYLRMARAAQIAPALVGVGTIVGAVLAPSLASILLAVGTWVFIGIAWRFMLANEKDIWAPAAETMTAYLDLCIRRCQRKLNDIRFGSVMAVLITVFVLVAVYQILQDQGGLTTASDFWTVTLTFAMTILVVSFVLAVQVRNRRKTQAELKYLLNLQRQLEKE